MDTTFLGHHLDYRCTALVPPGDGKDLQSSHDTFSKYNCEYIYEDNLYPGGTRVLTFFIGIYIGEEMCSRWVRPDVIGTLE